MDFKTIIFMMSALSESRHNHVDLEQTYQKLEELSLQALDMCTNVEMTTDLYQYVLEGSVEQAKVFVKAIQLAKSFADKCWLYYWTQTVSSPEMLDCYEHDDEPALSDSETIELFKKTLFDQVIAGEDPLNFSVAKGVVHHICTQLEFEEISVDQIPIEQLDAVVAKARALASSEEAGDLREMEESLAWLRKPRR